MKIMYLLYDTRLDKPISIHKSLKQAQQARKKYYGYSNVAIHQIIISDRIV